MVNQSVAATDKLSSKTKRGTGRQKEDYLPSDNPFGKCGLLPEVTHNGGRVSTSINGARTVLQVRPIIMLTNFWKVGIETNQTMVNLQGVT